MKRYIFILLFVVTSSLQAQEPPRRVFSERVDEEILVGTGDRSSMEEAPFSEWFTQGYEAYEPDGKILEKVDCPYLTEIEVTVVLGTWCPDSRREVPRFFKVADTLGIPGDHIRVIYVDLQKKAPGIDTDSMRIERVPTFIFTLYGKEAGRIIEVPRGSFEKEMKRICQIITDEKF
jgi:thiol-disulfide isomerase/thioredoxin